jgi:hypothetical protein
MKIGKSRSWVLWYVGLGFGLMILLTWLEEFTGLSWRVLGGEPHTSDWRGATMQSLLIVTVWAGVFLVMRHLVAHLLYLEGFLRVCAWCRKVGHKGNWLPLEAYFAEGFHVSTTHGVCPDCYKRLKEETALLYRKELKNRTSSKPAQPGGSKGKHRKHKAEPLAC